MVKTLGYAVGCGLAGIAGAFIGKGGIVGAIVSMASYTVFLAIFLMIWRWPK